METCGSSHPHTQEPGSPDQVESRSIGMERPGCHSIRHCSPGVSLVRPSSRLLGLKRARELMGWSVDSYVTAPHQGPRAHWGAASPEPKALGRGPPKSRSNWLWYPLPRYQTDRMTFTQAQAIHKAGPPTVCRLRELWFERHQNTPAVTMDPRTHVRRRGRHKGSNPIT